jgi:hypothetical protein
MCSKKDAIFPYYGDRLLNGFVFYQLPDKKLRPSIESLCLSEDHKTRSPTIHVFDSVTLVSRAFSSNSFPDSTLFCAWFESDPSQLIFWERHRIDGITPKINNNRFLRSSFLMQFDSLTCNFNNEQSSTKTLTETFQKMNLDVNHQAPVVASTLFEVLNSEQTIPPPIKFISDEKINSLVINVINAVDSESVDKPLNFFRVKTIKENNVLNTKVLIDDDDEIDSTRTISTLKTYFEEVYRLGDAMILARQNHWHNMNKTILNEFKSEWEKAIISVKEKQIDELLPDSEWLQVIWLYVIGCPSCVRSKKDLVSAIHAAFSELKSFDEKEIIVALEWRGFRPSLSRWFYDRCSFDSFEKDVLEIATFMSWNNSYLCTKADSDLVHYTHLHVNNETEFEPVEPSILCLRVDSEESFLREDITSLELNMENENWTPMDFTRSTFDKFKSIIIDNPLSYIYGHCCPEQAVVNMGKYGMSPLATYKNPFSCGHGMYFFKLDHEIIPYSCEDGI